MSNLTNTWKSRYLRIADQSESTTCEPYAVATDPSASTAEERIKAITNDPENVILMANGDKFMIIHSVSELGQTFRNPSSKIVCLQGLENLASPFLIDPESFVQELSVHAPSFNAIYQCNSVAELKALANDTRGSNSHLSFECTPIFIASPKDTKVILNAETNCPFECILALKQDRIARGGEDDTTTITLDPSHRIFRWLFSLGIGSLVKASLNIDNDDPDLREYSKKRHNLCILPSFNPGEPTAPTDTTHNTFVQLSSTISNLCESNNNANQLNALNFQRLAENDAKKKDRIKKFIDDDTLKCIKMAGSPDGENPLVDLPPEFVKSFNKETVGAFGKDLLSSLTQNGFPGSHIHLGTIQAIYNGNIINTDPNVVKDFNPFSFSETKPMQENQAENLMFLHMADLAGKPKAIEEITASMVQNVALPTDFYEMYESAARYHGTMKLIFTGESILYVSYEKFLRLLKDNKALIRALLVKDPLILTKILYAAEIRIKLFFKSCIESESREDVDDSLLEFQQITTFLNLRIFHIELPPVFIQTTPGAASTPQNPNKRKSPDDDKKKDEDDKEKRRVVKNDNVNPNFALRDDDNWACFTGRDAAELRPNHKGKRMCHKFLSKGYCFSDCPNAASHCPESEFTAEQLKGYGEWLEKCRKLNKTA